MIEFFQKSFGDLAKFTGFSLIAFVALLVCLIIKFSQLKKSKGEHSSFLVDCIAYLSITVGTLYLFRYDNNIAISSALSALFILVGALYLLIILLKGLFYIDEKSKEERKKLAQQSFSNLKGFFVLVVCLTFASIVNTVFFKKTTRQFSLLEEMAILATCTTLLNLLLIFIFNNFYNKEKKSTKPAFVINTTVFLASMGFSVMTAMKDLTNDSQKTMLSIAISVGIVIFYFFMHWLLKKFSFPKMFNEAVEGKEKEKKIEKNA